MPIDAQPSKAAARRRIAVGMLMLFACALCYDGNVDGPLDLYHEGERLAQIDRIDAGALPFRDFHVPHGLGEDVLKPLLARRLFGDSVAALRTIGQNSYIYRGWLPPLAAACIVLAAAMLTRSALAAAIACALVCGSLYEISERQVPGLLAVACLCGFLWTRRRHWLFAAGVCTAAGLLYSFEVGLYLLAVSAIWLPIDARMHEPPGQHRVTRSAPRLALFAAGLFAGIAPPALWAFSRGLGNGMLSTLHHQLFLRADLYPSFYPRPGWASDQPLSANLLVNGGIVLLFYAMPLAYPVALAAAWRWKAAPQRRSALVLAALTGGVFWGTVMGRPDLWHLAYAMAAFFPFMATALLALHEAKSRPWIRIASAAVLLLIAAAGVQFGQFGTAGRRLWGEASSILPASLRMEGVPLRTSTIPRLAGLQIPVQQADYLEALVGYIQSHTAKSDYILDLSDQGLIYYLAERQCPTRYAFINYAGTAQLRAEMAAEMTKENRLPSYVIRFTADQSTPDALGEFIDRHYKPETQVGPVVLMRKQE